MQLGVDEGSHFTGLSEPSQGGGEGGREKRNKIARN